MARLLIVSGLEDLGWTDGLHQDLCREVDRDTVRSRSRALRSTSTQE